MVYGSWNPTESLGDWAKIEGDRSKLQDWQLVQLSKWSSGRDPSEIMSVVASMTSDFKRVHQSLCKMVGMDEDTEWVEKVLNKVL